MVQRITPSARLLYIAPDNAEEAIAQARWFCKNNVKEEPTPQQIQRAITNTLETGHVGVLEHAITSFEIDLSRVTSHQLVRHRMASYVQESQRAVAQVPDVILPDSYEEIPLEYLERVMKFLDDAHGLYKGLQDAGMRREDARYILPQCFASCLRATANFRSWMHFLRLRLHVSAQDEIRDIAESIQSQLAERCPSVFSMEALQRYVEVPELTTSST